MYFLDRTLLTPLTFVAGLLAAILASYSSLQGLIVWPAGLLLLYLRGRTTRHLLVWCATALVVLPVYLYHLNPSEYSDQTYVFTHPVASLKFYPRVARRVGHDPHHPRGKGRSPGEGPPPLRGTGGTRGPPRFLAPHLGSTLPRSARNRAPPGQARTPQRYGAGMSPASPPPPAPPVSVSRARPSQEELARRFLYAHVPGTPLLMPNAWDVGSAVLFASLGFEALATTSGGFAASQGRLDGAMSKQEVLAHCGELVAAVEVPVSADLENCFADEPEGVAATITDAIARGLAGGSVEDFTRDPADPIYELGQATERVHAAAEAAHRGPVPFALTARAENYLHNRVDLADTICRLQAYQEAGADVLFAPRVVEPSEVKQLLAEVDRPVNVLVTPDAPSVARARRARGEPHLGRRGRGRRVLRVRRPGRDPAARRGHHQLLGAGRRGTLDHARRLRQAFLGDC